MSWSAAEKTTCELLKAYYRSGRFSDQYKNPPPTLPQRGTATLAGTAAAQGLAAFFYEALSAGKLPAELCAETSAELKKAAGRTALLNTLILREGEALFRELNRRGIDYTLLKGFAHLEKLYGSLWIRPVGDLDLLIHREELPRVKEVLRALGFTQYVDARFGGTKGEWAAIAEEYHNELHFYRSLGGFTVNVDLHWDLINLIQRGSPLEKIYPANDIPWFAHREEIILEGVPVRCLSLEMHFLHALFHFALGHKFAGAKWFLDLCQFAALWGERLNWALIYSTAARHRCLKLVAVTRELVAAVAGKHHWPVEAGGISLSAERISPMELRFYRQRLFAGKSYTGIYLCLVLLPPRWRDRRRVLSYLLFNKEAFPHWRTGKGRIIPGLQPLSLLLKAFQEQAGRLFKS